GHAGKGSRSGLGVRLGVQARRVRGGELLIVRELGEFATVLRGCMIRPESADFSLLRRPVRAVEGPIVFGEVEVVSPKLAAECRRRRHRAQELIGAVNRKGLELREPWSYRGWWSV